MIKLSTLGILVGGRETFNNYRPLFFFFHFWRMAFSYVPRVQNLHSSLDEKLSKVIKPKRNGIPDFHEISQAVKKWNKSLKNIPRQALCTFSPKHQLVFAF